MNKQPPKKINPLKFPKIRVTVENLTEKRTLKIIEANAVVLFTGTVKNPLKQKPDVVSEQLIAGEELIIKLIVQSLPQFLHKYLQDTAEIAGIGRANSIHVDERVN